MCERRNQLVSLYTQFKTKPEMLEKSLSIIRDEFKKIGLEVIEKITPQDVSIFMQKVMNQGNYQVIVLGPEK